MPVTELLRGNKNNETFEKFIDENIPPHKITTIITDLKRDMTK